jgi:hypothetical protein
VTSQATSEDDLETIIAALIERKRDLAEGSAEYRMVVRQLRGLRFTREEAAGIQEDLDPMGWWEYCRPLPSRRPAFDSW